MNHSVKKFILMTVITYTYRLYFVYFIFFSISTRLAFVFALKNSTKQDTILFLLSTLSCQVKISSAKYHHKVKVYKFITNHQFKRQKDQLTHF